MNGLSRAHAWRGYIGLSLVWLVVLGIALFVYRRPASQPIEILPPPTLQPTLTPLPSPTPGPLRVDVAGAVHTPGVYTLPAASIIADAIAAAGGPSDDADLDRVNKAVPLSDGMQVYVPHVAEAAAPQPVEPVPAKAASAPLTEIGAVGASEGGALVDINIATLAELDTLPGVGPATAQRIVDGRPYGSIEDLMRVKGIGQATFDKLKARITVK
jgi:competence protein ComEA